MSDSTPQVNGSHGGQWWLSEQGTVTGPHSQAYVETALRTGTLPPQTYACPVGAPMWHRLSDCPVFASFVGRTGPVLASASSSRSPSPLPLPMMPRVRMPWNPQTIAWLGLLFSPIWTGIMASLNGRRLGLSLPLWRPIAIGLGATLLDAFIELALFESWFFSLLLYCGALGIIWYVDLRPQVEAYGRRQTTKSQANWLIPVLAGSPAALVVFLAFIVWPLLPLQPHDVCQRFVDSSSLRVAKQYTTSNLWPALEFMAGHEGDKGLFSNGRYELTTEGPLPPENGGYFVEYRMYREESDGAHLLEGFFHLVDHQGAWKIEDCYFTAFDHGEAPEPVSLAHNYRNMLGGDRLTRKPPAGESDSRSLVDKTHAYLKDKPALAHAAGRAGAMGLSRLSYRNGKRVVVGIGVAILAFLSAIGKAMMGGNNESSRS